MGLPACRPGAVKGEGEAGGAPGGSRGVAPPGQQGYGTGMGSAVAAPPSSDSP
jgi:hypothetical protein